MLYKTLRTGLAFGVAAIFGATQLSSCSCDPETSLEQAALSPDGRVQARVESRIYGCYGGSAPRLEVYLSAEGTAPGKEDLVFSIPDEKGDLVSLSWVAANHLLIRYKGNEPVHGFRSEHKGVQIELTQR